MCEKYKCVLILLFLFIPMIQSEELRIMPYGDSITSGGQYRYALWKKLIDDGYKVEFMGSKKNKEFKDYKGQKWDGDHESIWGISAEWLAKPLKKNLEKTKQDHGGKLVDFVLYHIGTNDINSNDFEKQKKYVKNVSEKYIIQSIENFREHNPNIVIFLCKILPIKNNQTVRMALVDHFNKEHIEKIVKKMTTKKSPVILVDQNTGFNIEKGKDSYDGMHPNDKGGEKMAEKFRQAILKQLKAKK